MANVAGIPKGLHGWLWRHGPGWRTMLSKHRHAELELNIVLSGRGTYLVDRGRLPLQPGSLIWLFPRQDHLLVDAGGIEMWILVFRRRLLWQSCQTSASAVLRKQNPPEVFLRQARAGVLTRLDRLCQDVQDAAGNADLFNAMLAHLLLASWDQFCRAEESPAGPTHPAVDQAARLLRDDPTIASVDELAAQAGISPGRLSRLFRRQTGSTIVDFRNRLRVERFLLLHAARPDRTMLATALEAGFGSYAQFHRAFRRAIGAGPAEYERKGVST